MRYLNLLSFLVHRTVLLLIVTFSLGYCAELERATGQEEEKKSGSDACAAATALYFSCSGQPGASLNSCYGPYALVVGGCGYGGSGGGAY